MSNNHSKTSGKSDEGLSEAPSVVGLLKRCDHMLVSLSRLLGGLIGIPGNSAAKVAYLAHTSVTVNALRQEVARQLDLRQEQEAAFRIHTRHHKLGDDPTDHPLK